MLSGASGKSVVEPSPWASSSASFQLAKSSDSGPNSAYRSANVRHSIGLSIAVMTAMPSKPTFSSTYSTPLFAQTAASSSPSFAGSSARILREASEMSELPTQKNSLKPAPVPSSPTKKLNSGLLAETSSATAFEIGATVEEP